jgi:hypothetical protein
VLAVVFFLSFYCSSFELLFSLSLFSLLCPIVPNGLVMKAGMLRHRMGMDQLTLFPFAI